MLASVLERASELSGRIAVAVAVTVAFVLVGRLIAPLVRRSGTAQAPRHEFTVR